MPDLLQAPTGRPESTGPAVTPDALSPRELEVLRLIVNGSSNDEIARELYVTINTVKTFIRTAYRKIGVSKRTQAVIWGATHGLLEAPGSPA